MSARGLSWCLLILLCAPSALAMGALGATMPAAVPDAGPDHSDSPSERRGLTVDATLQDPAVRGAVMILDVAVTARYDDARAVQVTLVAPPALRVLTATTVNAGDLDENGTAHATFLVTTITEGAHEVRLNAVGAANMRGLRIGWVHVEGLTPARLELDYLADEPGFGGATQVIGAVGGASATDIADAQPGPSGRPWPATPGDDAGAPAAAASGPMTVDSATQFDAKICILFNGAAPATPSWQRARWTDLRAMADVAGSDRALATGITGKDGCATFSGLPRTVDGANVKLYFVWRSCNAAICVMGLTAPDGYAWHTGTKSPTASTQTLDFGSWGPASRQYASRVFAFGNNGWTWWVNTAKEPLAKIPTIDIQMPAQDDGSKTWYVREDQKIWVEVDGETEYSDDVTIHEFSHHVHWMAINPSWPSPGGQHFFCGTNQSPGLAWAEGLAEFAAVRANYDLGGLGVAGAKRDTWWKDWESIETSTCGDGTGNSEWRVARALWDLVDTQNDGFDDGSWSLIDLVFVVRSCPDVTSFATFYNDDGCSWVALGRNICVFQRTAFQNGWDYDARPVLSDPTPDADTWVNGIVTLAVGVDDADAGTGNCDTKVTFRAVMNGNCNGVGPIAGTTSTPSHTAAWNTAAFANGLYSICAYATDGMKEALATKSDGRYHIDNTPPRIVWNDQANEFGWHRTASVMYYACLDDGVGASGSGDWAERIDGGAWVYGTYPLFEIELEGTHDYEVRCSDLLGNEAFSTHTTSLDRHAPTVVANYSPAQYDRDGVVVSFSCSDPAPSSGCHVKYSFTNGYYPDYTGPLNITNESEALWAYAVDLAGNGAPNTAGSFFAYMGVERSAPLVYVNATSPNYNTFLPGWHIEAPTISIQCHDPGPAGVKEITYRVDGGRLQVYEAPFTLSGDGARDVTATCEDNARNVVNATSIVNIDAVAPTASYLLDGPGRNGWYTSNATLDIQCQNEGAPIYKTSYRLDNGTLTTRLYGFGTRYDISPLAGTHTIHAICGLYQWWSGEANGTIRFDVSPPTMATANSTGWSKATLSVPLPCLDQGSGCSTVYHRVDGGAWRAGPTSATLSTDGVHMLDAYADDVAGNVASVRTTTHSVDMTPPSLTYSLNGTTGSNGWYTSSVVLTLTCSDALSGLAAREYRLNNGTWTSMGETLTFGVSAARWLDMRCTDVAGNARISSTLLKIDRNPPTVTLAASATGWTNAANVTFTANCDDLAAGSGCAEVRYRIAGGSWATYAGSIVVSAEGARLVEAVATDAAGLVGPTANTTAQIDRTAPVATLSLSPATPANGWYKQNVVASANCADPLSGVASITTGYLGGAESPYVGAVTLSHTGAKDFTVHCRDAAGNLARDIRTVRIDTSAPGATLTGFASGSMFTLNWTAFDSVSGLSGTLRIEEQNPATGSIVTACSRSVAGSSLATGTCVRNAGGASRLCYRVVVDDVAGWTTTTAYVCLDEVHE